VDIGLATGGFPYDHSKQGSLMSLTIVQSSTYKGEDWWEWSVWLDGPDAELDQVKEVIYRLHPTFPSPVRTVRNRKSGFKLSTGGWGVFTIRATVLNKDGKTTCLIHELVLKYPDGTPTTA
jgi:transcription initiation factor IIF auxiliary subunit